MQWLDVSVSWRCRTRAAGESLGEKPPDPQRPHESTAPASKIYASEFVHPIRVQEGNSGLSRPSKFSRGKDAPDA
jgi:hypothetical protein